MSNKKHNNEYDDQDNYFVSNAAKDQDPSSLPLGEAALIDILRELDKRFDDMIFMGKRRMEAPATDERTKAREEVPRVDNRFLLKGDIHTLVGLAENGMQQLHMTLDMGSTYIRAGFGPGQDIGGFEDDGIYIEDEDDDETEAWK